MSLLDRIEDAPVRDKLFAIGAILVALAGSSAIYIHLDNTEKEKEWSTFVQVHNCKKVTEMEEIVTYQQGLTVGPDGAMHPSLHTTTIPSARAYVCDDGVTYWR